MCYDFKSVKNENIVTIMNFYKKGIALEAYHKNFEKAYEYKEQFFSDIFKLLKNIDNRNMIIFSGDFNANYNIISRIERMGFVDKIKHFENTMVEVPDVKPYHNDCIFVNDDFTGFVEKNEMKKIPENMPPQEIYDKYSDHYGFEFKINI
jgi:hypothetical protein